MMTWRRAGHGLYQSDEKPTWFIRKFHGMLGVAYALYGHAEPECLMFGTLIQAKRYAETL